MTNVFANSAALTLLQGTGAAAGQATSADTIIQIAAKIEGDKKGTPPEAPNTISSVTSQNDLSTMGRIVAATTLASAPVEGAAAIPSEAEWNAAADAAVNSTVNVVGAAVAINGKFHLQKEIDLDGLLGKIETQRQAKIANGESQESANKWASIMVRKAPGDKLSVEMLNRVQVDNATGTEWNASTVASRFGLGNVLSMDADKKATVKAFEITAASGQKLLSLGEDGTLTTFNQDGSIRTQQSKADVILLTRDGGNSFVYNLHRSGYDLNKSDLF